MKEITLLAAYGDERKKVIISQPLGAGDIYYINIDRYHQGQMFKRKGEWVGYFPEPNEITWADVMVIGEIIDNEL